jgi:hypothetical protein
VHQLTKGEVVSPDEYRGGGNMSFATTRPTALAAAGPTAGVVPAAADQVSAIHELFVNTLGIGSGSYAAIRGCQHGCGWLRG